MIDQGGLPPDKLDPRFRLRERVAPGEEIVNGWRSLSPELMSSLYPPEAAEQFERFTSQAFQVMTLAREEARDLKHDQVGPEHVLLGLLREEGVAAQILTSCDITLECARDRLTSGSADQMPPLLPYTPESQKVLNLALSEEPTGRPNQVGTAHLLLGLIGANEQTLLDLGVEPERIREEVQRALNAEPVDESSNG